MLSRSLLGAKVDFHYLRVRANGSDVALGNNAAEMQYRDPISQTKGDVHIVFDHKHRNIFRQIAKYRANADDFRGG